METIKQYATLIRWLLIVAAVLALVWALHALYQHIYDAGAADERGKWIVKEAALKLKASKELGEAKDANAQQVEALTVKIHGLEVQSVADKKDTEEKLRAARVRIAASGGLHDPGRRGPSCSSPAPQSTASTSGGDGEANPKLSDEASEFLSGEASRADGITVQLGRAQEYISELELFCSGALK